MHTQFASRYDDLGGQVIIRLPNALLLWRSLFSSVYLTAPTYRYRLPRAHYHYHHDSYNRHLLPRGNILAPYDSNSMNTTPRRVTGAYPATPGTNLRGRAPPTPPTGTPPQHQQQQQTPPRPSQQPLPEAPLAHRSERPPPNPVIPLNVLDAPTQRFYALGVYVALLAWKLYNWVMVVEDGTESFWLGLKWAFIDVLFIFGLPELRIPWLELSWGVTLFASIVHVIFDFILMLNIGVRNC